MSESVALDVLDFELVARCGDGFKHLRDVCTVTGASRRAPSAFAPKRSMEIEIEHTSGGDHIMDRRCSGVRCRVEDLPGGGTERLSECIDDGSPPGREAVPVPVPAPVPVPVVQTGRM